PRPAGQPPAAPQGGPAERSGDRGPGADRHWPEQPRHRRAAGDQRQDRRPAREQHPHQARAAVEVGGDGVRVPEPPGRPRDAPRYIETPIATRSAGCAQLPMPGRRGAPTMAGMTTTNDPDGLTRQLRTRLLTNVPVTERQLLLAGIPTAVL